MLILRFWQLQLLDLPCDGLIRLVVDLGEQLIVEDDIGIFGLLYQPLLGVVQVHSSVVHASLLGKFDFLFGLLQLVYRKLVSFVLYLLLRSSLRKNREDVFPLGILFLADQDEALSRTTGTCCSTQPMHISIAVQRHTKLDNNVNKHIQTTSSQIRADDGIDLTTGKAIHLAKTLPLLHIGMQHKVGVLQKGEGLANKFRGLDGIGEYQDLGCEVELLHVLEVAD